MCGIAGSYGGVWDERALDLLAHRGPDGRGCAVHSGVTHGHVRLAVMDPTPASDQPFRYRDGVLSYNGEVWNYEALRETLRAEGHTFATSGDTEVVAAALHEWGAHALGRMEGMFALAWSHGGRRILARDRFGKVPLYVQRTRSGFHWASERRALPSPGAGVPLPPASFLNLNDGALFRYYRIPVVEPASPGAVQALLRAAVRARLMADVPVCALISGGLDSSLILALAREVKPDVVAYTAVYDTASEDLAAARRLCAELGVPLREVRIERLSEADFARAVRAIEIPTKVQVEISVLAIPLAQRIAADGFKVCLSGEGADELFGGYGSMEREGRNMPDDEWRTLRIGVLERMARANFTRTNKAFMAAGVECRLPFLARDLVERVLSTGGRDAHNKRLLKAASRSVLPSWVARRVKRTFQGGAGVPDAAQRVLSAPQRFYNATARAAFGCLPRG